MKLTQHQEYQISEYISIARSKMDNIPLKLTWLNQIASMLERSGFDYSDFKKYIIDRI